jgi:hypothetical protein
MWPLGHVGHVDIQLYFIKNAVSTIIGYVILIFSNPMLIDQLLVRVVL